MTNYGPAAPNSSSASQPNAAPPPSTGPKTPGEWEIITELLETIDRDASNIEARRILAQQYENFGWGDEAAQQIRAILSLRPGDEEAAAWLIAHLHSGGDTRPAIHTKTASTRRTSYRPQKTGTLQDLQTGYKTLMDNAKTFSLELQIFQDLCGPSHNLAGQISDLKAIAEGRLTSVVKVRPPPATRAVAAKIKAASTLSSREEIAFNDLEANARYLRSRNTTSNDQLRTALVKRTTAVIASLPKDMSQVPETAFMHIEHEILLKTYQNTETMLGDTISSIPRVNFFTSEDGYAWDMSELAAAIKANGGVMRNPLSREMFSADDVGRIVRHPQGKELGALQLQQKELTQGVRKDTIDRLDQMAKVLLDDQSADSAPSRAAVEDFTLYVATLPAAEQEALDKLKVAARDSHTGFAFDTTVGDAVRDSKANRQCFHKSGDFLRQAAQWLRKNGSAGKEAKMPGAWE